MALEVFCWHAPALVLLGLPLFLRKWPLFHWLSLRGCATIPLCHFHSFFEVLAFLLPLSEGLSNLPSDLVPFGTVVKPALFCAFLLVTGLTFTLIRPMSKSLCCTQPPSKNNCLATFRCFSVQSSFVFLLSNAKASSSQIPSVNSSYSCFAAHFFQQMFWPAPEACSSHLLGKHISYRCFCRLRISRCATKATWYPYHGSRTSSCRSSYLLPHLNFSNLFHPSFSLFMIPFSPSSPLLPNTEWPLWKVAPRLQGHMLP